MQPTTEKRTALACKICGNSAMNTFYEVKEMQLGLREVFTYFECAQCQCLQLATPPSDLAKYYPTDYYSFTADPSQFYKNPLKNIVKGMRFTYSVTNQGGIFGEMLYRRNPDIAARALAPTGVTKQSRILDVGSGIGVLAYHLRAAGFSHITCIDPFIESTRIYNNGLHVLKESIYEMSGDWDLIMYHHVFEHLPDPLETLQQVHRLLAPNAMCLIRIPIASSYAWQHYRTNWVQIDAPRHFFLHSRKSMMLLAERTGFRIENVIYDSSEFQFWASEEYSRNIGLSDPKSYNHDHSVLSEQQVAAYHARSEELNKQQAGDQAAFYLRKV